MNISTQSRVILSPNLQSAPATITLIVSSAYSTGALSPTPAPMADSSGASPPSTPAPATTCTRPPHTCCAARRRAPPLSSVRTEALCAAPKRSPSPLIIIQPHELRLRLHHLGGKACGGVAAWRRGGGGVAAARHLEASGALGMPCSCMGAEARRGHGDINPGAVRSVARHAHLLLHEGGEPPLLLRLLTNAPMPAAS